MSLQTQQPIVAMRDMCKAFSGVKVLENARLDLMPGEVHALMGENGAGKSTLMKILAGIYLKDDGEILLDGRPVHIASPRSAQQHGIGIIHQELNLMSHLSAAQNIFIGREPRRFGVLIDDDALNRDAAAIFEHMHLKLDPRTRVGALSVAKQQMVEIAKALSFESRVLIMDEPTAALNSAEVADLFDIIRKLKAHGVAIVYISHKMDELQQIADRVTVMRDGKYVGTVPMATTSLKEIIAMMVGRELSHVAHQPPDTSRNAVALEVHGLRRGRAIRDVGFSVRKGEIVGFAGLMGAGRTEVARAIFGADPLDAGEIRVYGRTVAIRSPGDGVAAGIGYLSEDRKHFGLATGLDVESNIVLASLKSFLMSGGFVDAKRTHRIAESYVERLKIRTSSVDKKVKLLSGGNQQKIVIAKWLLRDCDILFFDEPTRGIDIGAKSEIYKLLDDMAAEGKAIVMISSELPEVLRMSHRVLVMCEGRITGELSRAEATQENIMQLATQRTSEAMAA